jgi:hypothetical protein
MLLMLEDEQFLFSSGQDNAKLHDHMLQRNAIESSDVLSLF